MTRILPFAVLACLLVAADKPAEKPADKKTDKELLQGTWVVTSAKQNGEVVKRLENITLTIKGDSITSSEDPNDKITFTIDHEKKPPTMDLKGTRGTEMVSQLAVYDLKGDELSVCIDRNGKEYPKEVAPKEGFMFLSLKRQKTQDKLKTDLASLNADLEAANKLGQACDVFKLAHGTYPESLADLAKNQLNGERQIIEPALLIPKSAEKFNYNPKGPNNGGLRVDVWVEGPRGKIGNWMKELPPQEKKPEKP
jgi:uncharacterized protein (TIGR03067 family)